MITKEKIAVIGLGYVGLPLAIELAKQYEAKPVIGYDVNVNRLVELKNKVDVTDSVSMKDLRDTRLEYCCDVDKLRECTFFIIAVPTPTDILKNPDLSFIKQATIDIAKIMPKGALVVYESTVYPGVTENICKPILEEYSGGKCGIHFDIGYSPERINPGDKVNTLRTITKLIGANRQEALDRMRRVYSMVVDTLHETSIKVAEASKVIENTQRDLNIAFINEAALICEKLGISTNAVLAAARTKWNFLDFRPGLVGGHCIGVDPHYLAMCAEGVGVYPELTLASRRINDNMAKFIAHKTLQLIASHVELVPRPLRIGVLGLTFKPDVPDIRNSKVPDIIYELKKYGVEVYCDDCEADKTELAEEYGLTTVFNFRDLDALIIAVPHQHYIKHTDKEYLDNSLRDNAVIVDVSGKFPHFSEFYTYWSL